MLLLSAVVGEGSVLRGSVVEGKFRGRGKLRSRGRSEHAEFYSLGCKLLQSKHPDKNIPGITRVP